MMKRKDALKLAIEILEAQARQVADSADLYDRGELGTNGARSCSLRRKKYMEAIVIIQDIMDGVKQEFLWEQV